MEERIAHRSHANRGKDEQPTIHEGVVARALERQGIVSDRCEINRQIKVDNALLRGLKQTVKPLTEAVKHSLSDITDVLETIRRNILILYYEMRCVRADKDALSRKLKTLRDHLTRRISEVTEELEELRSERTFILQDATKDKDMNALRTEADTL